jgi:hypothetical protein
MWPGAGSAPNGKVPNGSSANSLPGTQDPTGEPSSAPGEFGPPKRHAARDMQAPHASGADKPRCPPSSHTHTHTRARTHTHTQTAKHNTHTRAHRHPQHTRTQHTPGTRDPPGEPPVRIEGLPLLGSGHVGVGGLKWTVEEEPDIETQGLLGVGGEPSTSAPGAITVTATSAFQHRPLLVIVPLLDPKNRQARNVKVQLGPPKRPACCA